MSISTTIDFWCDICHDWTHFENDPRIRVQRKHAHAAGWITRKIDGEIKDICPHCQKTDGYK